VWRSYKNVLLLDERNEVRRIDLGLVHSSAADSLVGLILSRLEQEDLVVTGVSPNFLARNWPPALPEWSTRSVRDAFFASPRFPRLLDPEAVKQTIARGVEGGMLAYVAKTEAGGYDPFHFKAALFATDIEIADDVFVIRKEDAEAYLQRKGEESAMPSAEPPVTTPSPKPPGGDTVYPPPYPPGPGVKAGAEPPATPDTIPGFRWSGAIPPQKWMNFYTKVLTRFATAGGLELSLTVRVNPPSGVTKQDLEATRIALRELGVSEDLTHD
jgi:hypothetical protein